jgi:hypothetical protein
MTSISSQPKPEQPIVSKTQEQLTWPEVQELGLDPVPEEIDEEDVV